MATWRLVFEIVQCKNLFESVSLAFVIIEEYLFFNNGKYLKLFSSRSLEKISSFFCFLLIQDPFLFDEILMLKIVDGGKKYMALPILPKFGLLNSAILPKCLN